MSDPRSDDRAVRLIDVANEAGVSIATASRSLSRSPGVSERLADEVRETARRLGYVVNQHARTLASGHSSTIGLLVHEIGDPYFSEIASGVIDEAARFDMTVQICQSGRDPDTELNQIRTLIANRVGTIIIAGSGFVDPGTQREARDELANFGRSGGRVAVIGRHQLGVDAVRPDNIAGGRSIARHIVGLGHRRIAVAIGSRLLSTIEDRLGGIEEVFDQHRLGRAGRPIIEAAFTLDGGRAAAARILDEHPDTTAILALNDAMAIGVLSELRSRSIQVPTDVSVAGFDDVAVAAALAPGLTTIRLPMAAFGRLAVELAVTEPAKRPRRRATGHELIVRDSTGPPRPQ